jgi:CHAD domain-containing protein
MVGHLPGVFDGDVESIHQARIVTRRLREVLPLVGSNDPNASRAAETLRDAGRALGRVRELDVMRRMLEQAFDRVPAAAVLVAECRRAVQREQLDARRDMVKALEALELPKLAILLSRTHRPAWWRHRAAASAWRLALQQRIGERADRMVQAVQHATGVYFPNRSHTARVAVKKLRYAVEVAQETALWTPPRLLKHLRAVQSRLGDIHDLQVLNDRLDQLSGEPVRAESLSVLMSALQNDIARHHADYVQRRDRLFAIAGACHRFADRRGRSYLRRPVVAVSAAALPLLFLGRRKIA